VIYLASGLMGSALSLCFAASHVVSVGASGAIFGIAGALLVGVLFHKNEIPKSFWRQTSSGLAIFIFYSLMQGLSKQGIDNAAHMGGLICGSVLALFLPTQLRSESFNKNASRLGIAGAFLACVCVGLVAFYAPSAQVDIKQSFEARASFIATTAKLADAVKQLQKETEDVKSQKMTAIEQDERTRTVWAPVFKGLYNEYENQSFQAIDPLFSLAKDYKRLTQLLQEQLQMESVMNPTTNLPESINRQRNQEIEAEVKEIMVRINKPQKISPRS
jgi:rhomboid protease GluP